MVSCKGQHASGYIARVNEHAEFMRYMKDLGKAWGMLGERLQESWGGLENAWEDFGAPWGGWTLSEVFLGGGPFGGIFSGTRPLKKNVVEFIHGAGVHCEV